MSQSSILDQIANENNLRTAWIKVNYHARTSLEYFDKYAYDEFEENLDLNLAIIRRQLLNENYRFEKLRVFEIPKGDDVRKIYFLNPSDGTVSQAILNIIAPIFESQFSKYSFGNRISYASNESKNPFLDWHDQYTKYINNILSILEFSPSYWYEITDITDYYPSIDITKLLAKVTVKIKDASVLRLLEALLNSKAINLDEMEEDVRGLPPGTTYSHFLANLYLDDFDKFMEKSTVSYSRYVDDICFAVKSEENLIEINQRLTKFLDNLGNLTLKEKKTETHPITEPAPLIEHTRKLKYDLRFGVIESLRNSNDLNQIQMTEMVFHDLVTSIEREENISKVGEDAAVFIAAGFEDLSIETPLAIDIAYGLLSRRPQRIGAIRALLGFLMKLFITDPDERFIELLRSSPDIIKISFSQLLLGYIAIHEKISELLTTMAAQSDNYLVRASAYTALENLKYAFNINEFKQLIEVEKSDYVLARLTQCVRYSKSKDVVWADLRQILEIPSPLILNAVIFVAHKINYQDDNWVGTKILLPVLLAHPGSDLFSLAFLLMLVSKFSDYDALEQVYATIDMKDHNITETLLTLSWGNTFIYLAKRKIDYGKLSFYIDSLRRLKIPVDYSTGYQEILMKSSDENLVGSTKSAANEITPPPSLPKWYRERILDIVKGPYCEFLWQPNYSCREFHDGQRRGVFETIAVENILYSKEFNSVEEWLDYLRGLDKANVIKLIDLGTFMENGIEKVFVAYEIEPGFDSIRWWLNSDDSLLTEKSIVNILIMITEKLQLTKLAHSFYFQNINPCNVLWNPQGQIKLLNIGSTLLEPRYICGSTSCNKKYHANEVGPTIGIYFLGLLAVQMIEEDNCPLLVLEPTKSSPRKQNFYEINRITPHLKSVIARMVRQRPSHRYGELDTLNKDLLHVAGFIKKRDAIPAAKNSYVSSLTLVDYLDFRLKIVERTPDAPLDSLQKANWVLEKLAEQISYYSDKETINVLFARDSKVPFTNPRLWYWLSPEGRTMLGLAFDWDDLIRRINEQLGFEYSNKLSNMLFGRVVYFEALAAMQGVLTFASLNKQSIESFRHSLLQAIQNNHFHELRIKAPRDRFSQSLPNPYSNEDINTIINLFQFVDGNNWIYVLQRLSAKCIFSGISFSRHEVDFFFSDETKAFTTVPLHKANSFTSKTWLIHKLPYKLIGNISSNVDATIDSMWEDVIKIIFYLRSMNPCKRKRGKLIDYIYVAVPQQGNISYGWNWISFSPREANFTDDRVLTLGNLVLITKGRQRAIQIDLIDKINRISSIFSYSKIFNELKSSSRMSFESAVSYFMKTHRGFAWTVAILLAVLEYLFASPVWKLPMVIQLLLGCLVILINRLVINPFWKKVQEQLAIMKPEDKVLETN